jgi:hypothetical protein
MMPVVRAREPAAQTMMMRAREPGGGAGPERYRKYIETLCLWIGRFFYI